VKIKSRKTAIGKTSPGIFAMLLFSVPGAAQTTFVYPTAGANGKLPVGAAIAP
jgi:hypothetical protein